MGNILEDEIFEGAYEYIKKFYTTSQSDSDMVLDQESFEKLALKTYNGIFKELGANVNDGEKYNLANLFTYGVDIADSEKIEEENLIPDEEKEGNIVPWIKAGSIIGEVFNLDIEREKIKEKDLDKLLKAISKRGKILIDDNETDSEQGISSEKIVLACLEARVVSISTIIKNELDNDKSEFVIEDGGFIIFKGVKDEDGNMEIILTPGPLAKMLVKHDEETEED